MTSSNNDENKINIDETKQSRTIELHIMTNDDDDDLNNINNENDDGDDIIIMKNLCIECNVDMGDNNPRQLCGKTQCLQSDNVNCTYENDNDNNDNEEPPKKKKKKKKKQNSKTSSFPTVEEFTEKAKKVKPTKWIDLDRTKIFQVVRIEEIEINQTDGSKRIAKVAVLVDSTGENINVWLPGVIANELICINVSEVDTYIRSLGPKTSAKTGRTYQNFEIVKL